MKTITEKKKKKCVTFWIDKDLLEQFNSRYFIKSQFMRECIKKALNDEQFFIDMIQGGKNEKELL